MTTKTQRQHVVERLLSEHAVANQTQLVGLLEADGIDATQATVSRDLDELGAVKVRVGDRSVYAIPEMAHQRSVPLETLRRVCGDWVAGVDHSHHLVVLRTPPGSAHVVASAIDRSNVADIVGTVAGDDTILVIAAETTTGAAVADYFRDLAGLE